MIPHYDSKIDINSTKNPQRLHWWPTWEEDALHILHRCDSRKDQRSRHQTEVPSEGDDVLLSSGFMAGNSNTSWKRKGKMSEVCFFILHFTKPSSLRKTTIWKGIVQTTGVVMRKWETDYCWLNRLKTCFLNLHNDMQDNRARQHSRQTACWTFAHVLWIQLLFWHVAALLWCCWSQWGTWWDDRSPSPSQQLVAIRIPVLCRRSRQWTWLRRHPQLWPEKKKRRSKLYYWHAWIYNLTLHLKVSWSFRVCTSVDKSRRRERKNIFRLFAHLGLLLEKLSLSDGIVQLGVSIADFLLHHKELKTLRQACMRSVPGKI